MRGFRERYFCLCQMRARVSWLGASRTKSRRRRRPSRRRRKEIRSPKSEIRRTPNSDIFRILNIRISFGSRISAFRLHFCCFFLARHSYYFAPFACRMRPLHSRSVAAKSESMPLTHTKELFAKALKGKYALGAFNVNNMELLQAIVEACEEEKAPVMLQISKGARQYANPVYLKKLVEAAISLSNIPIAVHLDHGDSFDLCKECIEEGGSYSKEGHYTHPEEAVEFVQRSGVDSLAVAIGNSHGAYKFKGEQHLDLDRLAAIKKALSDAGLGDYPLVLHGASSVPKDLVEEINKYGGKLGSETSGVSEADIEVARRIGCTKVNIDTDLRLAMTAAIRKAFAENPKEFDPRKYLAPARMKVKELVRHKVSNVLCCAGHAFD